MRNVCVFLKRETAYEVLCSDWSSDGCSSDLLRIVLGRLAGNGMACAGDVGIESLADLKGKRIGYVKGNPSVNVKTDASLAFSGLDRDSVEAVWFGSYGALKTAVIANQLDCFSSVTTSANTREMEASPRGIDRKSTRLNSSH